MRSDPPTTSNNGTQRTALRAAADTKRRANLSMVPIRSALKLAELIRPRFELRDRAVILADAQGPSPKTFSSLSEAESSLNHVHVLDIVRHRAAMPKKPFWDSTHQDSQSAVALGELFVDAWATKLARDFPRRRFRVYFTRDDNPVVRFHQVRRGEPAFLSESSFPRGAVIVRPVG